MRLEGQAVLITGASRGIGRAIALRLASEGARVGINYHRHAAEAEQVAEAVRRQGGTAVALAGDVSQAESAQALVAAAQQALGGLDGLVNNAGIVRDNLLLGMEEDEWSAVLATNLGGVFHCCQAAAKLMVRQRRGRIVNISSVSGERPGRGQVNYAAAKGGVNALTKALAQELAPRNITVNAVAPGMIETEMSERVRSLAGEQILAAIALRRYGQPEEVAAAVAFFLAPEAGYITGQILNVDGGLRG
ncbi:MAG TPA: 3-oxoacyl-ACP reductase family protein [Terriglobales bacterium]|nr:3-oxoacyl-ACP reductase family protein [Terriglobales bacterium]